MKVIEMSKACVQQGKKTGFRALPRITRLDVSVLLLLSVLLVLFIFANIDLVPASADKRQYLALGLSLSQTGRYANKPEGAGEVYYRREPFYPGSIALVDLFVGALSEDRAPMECAAKEAAQTEECLVLYAPYVGVNGIFLAIASVAVFLIVFWTTGNRLLGYSGYLLVASSSALLRYSGSFYSELPAAALMTLAAALAVRALRRPGALVFGALGLTLAVLTLTKVVFVHLSWITAVSLLAAAMLRVRGERRGLLVGILVMSAAAVIPVAGWMARNAILGGDFALSEKRASNVYSVRASYNRMTDEEYGLGFLYYLPHVGERGLERMGVDPTKFARFNTRNPEGFRQTGMRERKERSLTLAKTTGLAPPHATIESRFDAGEQTRTFIDKQVAAEAKAELLSDPWRHLQVSLLLAERSAFPERGLGYYWRPRVDRSVGDLVGLEWVPRTGYRYSGEQTTLFNLITGSALLLLPVASFLRGRDLSGLLIALPALYSHGAYALVSHFIPRYAVPEIPLRVAATLVLFGLLYSALLILAQKAPSRSRCLQFLARQPR